MTDQRRPTVDAPADASVGTADRQQPADARPLVIVTGGSGLLGSVLIERLLGSCRVVSLDLDGDPTSPAPVEFICTDLTDDDSVGRAFGRIRATYGGRIASVVHLAAYYDFAGRDSPLYEQVTVEGTRRLLDQLADFDVEQFVFSSTMLVHEPTDPGDMVDESDEIEKSWPYPASKIETESVIRDHDATRRMSTVVVRIAGVYDETGHSPPITNQIKRIDGRWPTSHFYPADLDSGQAFVHLDDAVDALERIVVRRRELPDWFPVLIGESETVGYADLQDAIGNALHGRDWPTFRIPAPLAKVGAWVREKNPLGEDPFIRSWMVDRAADHYDLDISSAREELGWEPRHRVVDAIPAMVRRLEADRDGWYAENGMTPPRRLLPA
jgi:nucleoside-diphosphate-sugar epimerase